MGCGHRHAEVLDYSLAQVGGYAAAHRALRGLDLARQMDVARIAAHADAGAYTLARAALVAPAEAPREEPAWQRARRAFERAGIFVAEPDPPPQ